MNRWVLVWIQFNVFKGNTQTKTLKRVFADHIQSAFSSIHVFFKEKQKVIMSPFPTGIFWFVFNDWHHSWHNNGLRRLTGLWRKKSQRDLAEGMLGMLVQCIRIPLWYLQSRLCASCHAYRIIMSFRKFIPPFTLTGQNIGKNRNFTPWTIPTENNNNQ